MLTDSKLRNLKPQNKVADRDGLYVDVTPAITVSIRYNHSIYDHQETITFGHYGEGGITLAEARERLVEAKRMVADGKPPILLAPVRMSDLLHVTWDEIDFEASTQSRPAGRMKAGRAYVICMDRIVSFIVHPAKIYYF